MPQNYSMSSRTTDFKQPVSNCWKKLVSYPCYMFTYMYNVHAFESTIFIFIWNRRTGKDIRAGKNIRKDADGYEIFEDYFSESGIFDSHAYVGKFCNIYIGKNYIWLYLKV